MQQTYKCFEINDMNSISQTVQLAFDFLPKRVSLL